VSTLGLSIAEARRPVVPRAYGLRLFALLIALLGVLAQQRVLSPAARPSSSVVRLMAERVQSIETHAVRAEPALRVPAAPIFARVPWFPEPAAFWRPLGVEGCRAPLLAARAARAYTSISHFHGQRRIPRMNSEEPPRA